MLMTVPRDAITLLQLYLAANLSDVGVDVDGLAYPCTVLRSTTVK
jgi:hypothetical protein